MEEDEIISINISPARVPKKEKSREELISNLHKALSELQTAYDDE